MEPKEALRRIIDINGPGILTQKTKVLCCLKETCESDTRFLNSIAMAVDAGIVQSLINNMTSDEERKKSILNHSFLQMVQQLGVASKNAKICVDALSYGLGWNIECGCDKPNPVQQSNQYSHEIAMKQQVLHDKRNKLEHTRQILKMELENQKGQRLEYIKIENAIKTLKKKFIRLAVSLIVLFGLIVAIDYLFIYFRDRCNWDFSKPEIWSEALKVSLIEAFGVLVAAGLIAVIWVKRWISEIKTLRKNLSGLPPESCSDIPLQQKEREYQNIEEKIKSISSQ